MPSLRVPEPSSPAITKSMKSNRSSGTKPELAVRRYLREAGYPGYRLNWKKAPGKPDICYPGRKVAIFVNGCFWHRCPRCNLPLPKSHVEYWSEKLRRNVDRDRREISELESEGWTVIVIWECEVKEDLPKAVARITSVLSERLSRRIRSPVLCLTPEPVLSATLSIIAK